MKYKNKYKDSVTQQDTGWGVIYRLNDLFREVETLAPSGKYDDWNFKLDRIFSNLCYKTPLKVNRDKEENIIGVEVDEEAYRIKLFLDSKILESKKEMSIAKKDFSEEQDISKNKNYIKSKKSLYKAIFLKEIWLRKYMQELGLYLKEIEYNPAGAMFNK